MHHRLLFVALLGLTSVAAGVPAAARPAERFFKTGDGTLQIRSTKNTHRFSGRYRDQQGRYIRKSIARINQVFGARHGEPGERISLRLIELLARVQEQLEGGWITISSGYRSPTYNRNLRDKGGVVAKASLHQFGMAADLRIGGVPSKKLWAHVRDHRLGGAGYYGSPWVHLDVGQPRSWTQGTAKVRTGRSDHNKLIALIPQYDIYEPGDVLQLRFARMTAYPIPVRSRGFTIERREGEQWAAVRRFRPRFGGVAASGGRCAAFNSIAEMADITWRLPQDLSPGRYRVRVGFCASDWAEMPAEITTQEIEVRGASPVPGQQAAQSDPAAAERSQE